MSDDESDDLIRKRPRYITHGTIDNIPYFVVDAWIALGMNWMNDLGLPVERKTLSHGSSRYEMILLKRRIGWVDTIALSGTRTRIECTIAGGVPKDVDEPFKALVTEFVAHFVRAFQPGEPVDVDTFLPLLSSTQIQNIVAIQGVIADIQVRSNASTRKPRNTSREPPAPDAPIDTWLDWRETELKQGRSSRSVSLPRIAKESIHSLSTLKRHSAARGKKLK